jgi:hypothetical protein
MTVYDYRVVPAPKKLKKVKGLKSTSELFAATLAEAINAVARDGWEYVRSESLSASVEGGLLRRGAEVTETVLIFRRARESYAPRLAAVGAEEGELPRLGPVDRVVRREPRPAEGLDAATPLRTGPRLGPADTL